MPYIENRDRENIRFGWDPITYGQLNYAITKIIDSFLVGRDDQLRYEHINGVIGVLECAKLELYRRIAVPYEDLKKESNGDVYTER